MSSLGIVGVSVEDRVEELLLSQYQEAENLKKYIKAFVMPIETLKKATSDCIESRNFRVATGYSLDKIAKVVGEDRVVRGADALGLFGFKDEPSSLGLDFGKFFSYGDKTAADLVMSDPILRNAIQARILKNISGGRIEDIIKFCELVTGQTLDIEMTEGVGSIHLRFHLTLTPPARLMLAIRIKEIVSVGVSVTLEDDAGDIEVINGTN